MNTVMSTCEHPRRRSKIAEGRSSLLALIPSLENRDGWTASNTTFTKRLDTAGQDSTVFPELTRSALHAPEHIGLVAFAGRHRSS